MQKYIEVTGKTEDEALAKGLQQLGLDRDDVSVEILERGKTGFLGIGSVPAKVKLTYEAPDEPEPVIKPEPVVKKKPEPKPQPRPRQEKKAPAPQPKKQAAPVSAPAEKVAPVEKSAEAAPADDDIAAAIVKFQTGLFAHMGVEATPVVTREGDTYQVVLEGEDMGGLIGRRGETLDAIILTGGISHDKALVANLTEQVGWIAPIEVRAGEFEMEALAAGGCRVLAGEEQPQVYTGEKVFTNFDYLKN